MNKKIIISWIVIVWVIYLFSATVSKRYLDVENNIEFAYKDRKAYEDNFYLLKDFLGKIKKNGEELKVYYKNNVLALEGKYQLGRKNGVWKYYDIKGKEKQRFSFQKGRLKSAINFNESGRVEYIFDSFSTEKSSWDKDNKRIADKINYEYHLAERFVYSFKSKLNDFLYKFMAYLLPNKKKYSKNNKLIFRELGIFRQRYINDNFIIDEWGDHRRGFFHQTVRASYYNIKNNLNIILEHLQFSYLLKLNLIVGDDKISFEILPRDIERERRMFYSGVFIILKSKGDKVFLEKYLFDLKKVLKGVFSREISYKVFVTNNNL